MWEKIEINANVHVMKEDEHDKFIYKVTSVTEAQDTSFTLVYNLELVAGLDYLNSGESSIRGFVSPKHFVNYIQWDSLTVCPLSESLGDRLKEEGYKIVNIQDYTVHE